MTPFRFSADFKRQCRCWLSSPTSCLARTFAQWERRLPTNRHGADSGGPGFSSNIRYYMSPGLCESSTWRRCSSIPGPCLPTSFGCLAFIEALILHLILGGGLAYALAQRRPSNGANPVTTIDHHSHTTNPLAAPGLGAPSIRARCADLRAASCNPRAPTVNCRISPRIGS